MNYAAFSIKKQQKLNKTKKCELYMTSNKKKHHEIVNIKKT